MHTVGSQSDGCFSFLWSTRGARALSSPTQTPRATVAATDDNHPLPFVEGASWKALLHRHPLKLPLISPGLVVVSPLQDWGSIRIGNNLSSWMRGGRMGTFNNLWSIAKKRAIALAMSLTISDRYVTVTSVTGASMHPTFTEASSALRGDFVLLERTRLHNYKFSQGDVVLFKCPRNHKKLLVKRLIALPGERMQIPGSPETIKIPEGHCWVEGDNSARSWDSRAFGPIPLGLVIGRVTHTIWPPSKIGKVERKMPEGRISPF